MGSPYDSMANRSEGDLLGRQLRHCCFYPTRFAMRLASGDAISVSRWGEWIVLELGQVRTFLSPFEAQELSERILEAGPAPEKKVLEAA
jgi:hypothetical protein